MFDDDLISIREVGFHVGLVYVYFFFVIILKVGLVFFSNPQVSLIPFPFEKAKQ